MAPFGLPCSINFPDHLNLLNCKSYNAKTCFLLFQASHFGIKNQSTIHVFQTPFLDIIFSFNVDLCKRKNSPLRHLQNPVGAKTRPKIDQVAPKWLPKNSMALPILYLGRRQSIVKRQEDWTFIVFISFNVLHFPVLALQLFKNI